MRWRGRRQSSNVEDRRGRGGSGGIRRGGGGIRLPIGRRGGGRLGIGTVAIILIAGYFLGFDPSALLSGGGISLGEPERASAPSGAPSGTPSDEGGKFAATILADTEQTFGTLFEQAGERYRAPTLVLFTGQVRSACGFASSASGPFYCPGDSKLYIDLSFFEDLKRRFDAPGDFAQAYVIAHEVGHHVQNLFGILPKFHQMRGRLSETEYNALSVRIELQADCFAGVWGHHAAAERNYLERGDIDEALNAAAQIGDDAIQRRSQGYVVPESFNHGTSEQRKRWFRIGLKEGRLNACDTLNADRI